MPIKVKGRDITFLKTRKTISKYEKTSDGNPYIIKMKKPEEITEDYKIPILSDCFFKTMFVNEERKKYSCLLLSYLLNISYEKLLKNLEFGKNELDKRKNISRGERADFIAYIDGTAIDIEINCNNSIETLERNIEYMDRLYSKTVQRGDEKYIYTQSILVNINNFAFKGKDKVKYVCYITDDDNEAITDKKIIIQIYIPNLIKKWYTSGVDNLTEEERYLLMLVLSDYEKALEIGKGNEIMEEYIKESYEVCQDEDFKDAYRKEWDLMDQGFRDGYDDGIKEGIEKNRYEIINKMIEKKIDINTIMDITGLSKKEIEAYRNK